MNTTLLRVLIALWAGHAILCAGCSSLSGPGKSAAAKMSLAREQPEVLIAAFEAKREEAQLQAAMNRWKEGNSAACGTSLQQLVERRPKFVAARVQYGEWLLSQGQVELAEKELRVALQLAPARADVHHSLAVILEAAGKSQECREHFSQAAKLQPDNELYQLSAAGG